MIECEELEHLSLRKRKRKEKRVDNCEKKLSLV